jgi:hypothetical protein
LAGKYNEELNPSEIKYLKASSEIGRERKEQKPYY